MTLLESQAGSALTWLFCDPFIAISVAWLVHSQKKVAPSNVYHHIYQKFIIYHHIYITMLKSLFASGLAIFIGCGAEVPKLPDLPVLPDIDTLCPALLLVLPVQMSERALECLKDILGHFSSSVGLKVKYNLSNHSRILQGIHFSSHTQTLNNST